MIGPPCPLKSPLTEGARHDVRYDKKIVAPPHYPDKGELLFSSLHKGIPFPWPGECTLRDACREYCGLQLTLTFQRNSGKARWTMRIYYCWVDEQGAGVPRWAFSRAHRRAGHSAGVSFWITLRRGALVALLVFTRIANRFQLPTVLCSR